jgi:hypothetical protein
LVVVVVVAAADGDTRQHDTVEVIFPEPAELQTGGTANATSESVASASSNAAASTTASIAEKAIGALPSEMAEMANDPKRGPIFRPRLAVWILVRYCKGDGSVYFLPKKVLAGIQRFKHLSGGFGNVGRCAQEHLKWLGKRCQTT